MGIMKRLLSYKGCDVRQEDGDCTFSPDTGGAVQVLAGSAEHWEQLTESHREKVERLACRDAQRKEAAATAAAQQYYSQFPFRPNLNPRSLRLAKARYTASLFAWVAALADRKSFACKRSCTWDLGAFTITVCCLRYNSFAFFA